MPYRASLQQPRLVRIRCWIFWGISEEQGGEVEQTLTLSDAEVEQMGKVRAEKPLSRAIESFTASVSFPLPLLAVFLRKVGRCTPLLTARTIWERLLEGSACRPGVYYFRKGEDPADRAPLTMYLAVGLRGYLQGSVSPLWMVSHLLDWYLPVGDQILAQGFPCS